MMNWILLLSVFASIRLANGNCNGLTKKEGQITYQGYYYKSDDCAWNLPSFDKEKYVLFLYLSEKNMTNGGYLYLQGFGSLFSDSVTHCRVFKSRENNLCSYQYIISNIHNVSKKCNNNVIYTVSELPQKLSFYAWKNSQKSFKLDYKYIECPNAAATTEKIQTTDIMSTEGSTSSYATTTETTSQNNSSPNNEAQQGTHGNEGYQAGIAILCILLVCACAVIVYLIYRLKNLKARLAQDGSGPEHVAYANQEAPGNNEHEIENVNYKNANLGRQGENEYDVATNPNLHSQEKETVYNELYRM